MRRLSSHPSYPFLKWIAYWKVFNFTHSRGFWYPLVPILIASALVIKAVNDASLSDYLIWLSMVMYLGELPLLIALSRRAFLQTIGDIGIHNADIHHVKEGLLIADFEVAISDDMSYGEFVICDLIGQMARK